MKSSIPAINTPGAAQESRAAQRAKQRSTQMSAAAVAPAEPPEKASPVTEAVRGSLSLTRKFVAVAAVVALILISSFSSLRLYFDQEKQLAQARAQLIAKQQAIDELNDELARWKDPSFVKAQARERLGWVVPGEVSFQVVDAEGNRITGASIAAEEKVEQALADQAWYETLWGSVKTADHPVPADESGVAPEDGPGDGAQPATEGEG
jgi:cell division protein FtsB